MTTPSASAAATLAAITALVLCGAGAAAAEPPPAPPPPDPTHGYADPITGDIVNGDVRQHLQFANDLRPSDAFAPPDGHALWSATMTIAATAGTVVPAIPLLSAHDDTGVRYPAMWWHASPEGINPSAIPEGQSVSGAVYFAAPPAVKLTGLDYSWTPDVSVSASEAVLTTFNALPATPAPPGTAPVGPVHTSPAAHRPAPQHGDAQTVPDEHEPADPDPAAPAENPVGAALTDSDGGAPDAAPDPNLTQFISGRPVTPPETLPPGPDTTPPRPPISAPPQAMSAAADTASAPPPASDGQPVVPPVAIEGPAPGPGGPIPAHADTP